MEQDYTYKIKCRSCGKIKEMWFAAQEQVAKADFLKWVSEHSAFPIQTQCECDNGSMLLHDVISFKPIV